MPEPSRRVIKKVDGGHGHHGGAWKVAYADFVTAMMALFMVLWLLASSDVQSRKEISNYFRTGILPEGSLAMNHAAQLNPSVIEASPIPPPPDDPGDPTAEQVKAADIKGRFSRLAAADPELAQVIANVHVTVTKDGILIEAVDGDKGMLFDSASAKLTERMERFLRVLGPVVGALHAPVEIHGHTDGTPYAKGAIASNWDLSYARAAAARQLLEDNGVAPAQIAGVYANGAAQPYDPADPRSPKNRRLSFLIRFPRAPKPAAVVPPIAPVMPAAGAGVGSADAASGSADGATAKPADAP